MRKLLVLALAFFSCADLGRNNPYDPDSKKYDPSLTGENNISSSIDNDKSSSSSSLASSSSFSSSVDEGTVKIGNQVWMAKNLDSEVDGSKCYDDKQENCVKYGRLYDWTAAKSVCPEGFHLPTKEEWIILINYIGSDKAGKSLKAKNDWNTDNGKSGNGDDSYGFSALPAGSYSSSGFTSIGTTSFWWSNTEASDSKASYLLAANYSDEIESENTGDISSFRSVRCLKDQN